MTIYISPRQLQRKFKHAAAFGVSGEYNSQTAAAFEAAILAHLQKPGVLEIAGTYRREPVKHYFDPLTNWNVIVDGGDNFISGWKLTTAQVSAITTTGEMGGG